MITRWLKENSLLIGFGAAFVLIVGGASLLLWKKQSTYRRVETNLEEKQGVLNQLHSKSPAPTTNNLELLNSNNARLQDVILELHHLSRQNNQNAIHPPADRIAFAQHLRQTLNTLEGKAQAANVKIPKNFRFGFNRYATTLPKRDHPVLLNRLTQQLSVIQQLTTLMIQDGVEQIDDIHRTDLEENTGTATNAVLTETINTNPQEHYTQMPFELQFACNASALQKFVNHIANDEYFFVIRMINIDQEPIVVKKGEEMSAALSGRNETSTHPPASLESPRLRVTLHLDFIQFIAVKQKPEAGT